MRRDILIYAFVITAAVILFATPASSQEKEGAAKVPQIPQLAAGEEVFQPEELSIYGEVQDVSASSNSIRIQYYDYDSDEEKLAEIILNKDTKLENASSVNDIKKADWVDVTYTISDGKNVAISIIVEKEEDLDAEMMPEKAPTDLPEEEL